MTRSIHSKDYMTEAPVTVRPETEVVEAINLLIKHKISGATVVDADNRVVGVISELDCLKAVLASGYHGEMGGLVGDYMTRDVEFADLDSDILTVAKQMLEHKRRRLPVVLNGKFHGQFSARSVLQAILKFSARFSKPK